MRDALGRRNAVKDNKVSSHARGWRIVCWLAFSVWAQQAIPIWSDTDSGGLQLRPTWAWPLGRFDHFATRRKFQLLVQLTSCLSSRVSSSFHFPFISYIASSGPSQRTVNFWHCQYGFLYYTCLQITGCHVVHALLHVLFHRLLLYRSAAMWLCYYNSKKCYNDRKLSQFNKICSWRQNTSYSRTANMNRAWYCRLL